MPETRAPLVTLTETVALVPIMRGSLASAIEVRDAMEVWKPDVILVEFPRAIAANLRRALAHLPEVHLLAWRSEGAPHVAYLALDPCDARVEAWRIGRERGIPVEPIDAVMAASAEDYAPLPDHITVERLGAAALAEAWLKHVPAKVFTDRQRLMAGRIARIAADGMRVLVVADLIHVGAFKELLRDPEKAEAFEEEAPGTVRLVERPARVEWLAHLLGELPAITLRYENARNGMPPGSILPVADAMTALLFAAAAQYKEEFDEEVNMTEWRALFQFGRNLSLVRGIALPRLYELVTTARACVDDDFGALVLDLLTQYPPNVNDEEEPDERFRRRSLSLYFDAGAGLVRGTPAYPWPEMATFEFHFRRRRPSPMEVEHWQKQFAEFSHGMCSWPPEDERIEKFFDFLRKRALAQISASHTLVEEFSSSMQDGLDFRETMRNWHKNKLYVRRERTPPGRVGPVVLVWRDCPLEEPDVWKVTFYAEHQNESDIAFFGAPLGRDMVGPLVSRTEYHGILSVFPASHIPDIWQLEELYEWGTCARMLLAAAILLSKEKYVAWIAPGPPDRDLVEFARAHKVAIITIPLSSFSRKTLKRLRQVHVLGSKLARTWAGDYIDEG